MYEEYFGLTRPPFKISPDTSLFFKGGKRGDILGALVYAIHRGEGIIKVVGEVGSGKTMLCRMLQLKLPKSVEIVYIGNPSVSAEDILFVIAHELELPVTKGASKHEVIHMLQDYLLQRHIENKQVVLFIEEAQGMPLQTLEEIRLLSNLETDQHKLLQIILFGQPELDENLSKKSIRQLRERITHSFELSPLSAEEIHKYLNFRMREVGYTGPELITLNLAKKIASYSGGLVRRINIIADKILLSAFAESTHNLTTRHIVAAVNDSAFGDDVVRKNTSLMWWLALLVIIALSMAVYKTEPVWEAILGKFGVNPVELVEKQQPKSNKNAETEKLITENDNNHSDTAEQVIIPVVAEATVTGDNDTNTGIVAALANEEQAAPQREKVVTATVSGSKENKEIIKPSPTAIEATAQVLKTAGNSQSQIKQKADIAKLPEYYRWLDTKLQQSREWLISAQKDNVSIQVLMSHKSSEGKLVYYLQNEWPLNLDKTYLYEVEMNSRKIYRVFYSEFDSVAQGRDEMQRLPETVKANSPYLHSIYRMQKALL